MALDTANALVSLAEAKAFLKIGASSEDTVIESFINRASTWANDYTGRLLLTRSLTEYYDGDATGTLLLKNYPVTTLTSIHVDEAQQWAAWSAIELTDVILDSESGMIKLFNKEFAFNSGLQNIRVIYTAGYGTVPEPIKEAVLFYVAHLYRRQYSGQMFGVQSESVGDRTTTYATEDFPARAKALLNRYRSHSAVLHG